MLCASYNGVEQGQNGGVGFVFTADDAGVEDVACVVKLPGYDVCAKAGIIGEVYAENHAILRGCEER